MWIRALDSPLWILLAALSSLPMSAVAQNQTLEITKLADGVYAAIYSEVRMDPVEGNSLIVVGDEGVLVLDTGRTPDAARTMISEIRKLTSKPVRYVVNSHWHDDHIFGNQAYAEAFPGVQIVAHRQTRDDMRDKVVPSLKEYGVEYWTKMADDVDARLAKGTTTQGAQLTEQQKSRLQEQSRTLRAFLPKIPSLRVVLPSLTIRDGLTVHDGSREIRILHLGIGNTQGDVIVYLPKERILATGDLLVHPVPFAYGSSWPDWIDTLKKLRALDADVILPGHGPLMRDTAYLDSVIELFESLTQQVRAAIKRGLTLDETKQAVDLEKLRIRFTGDDPVRKGMFADSLMRSALEDVYKALTPTSK
ncbi:MAG TPA: MBL fold metallo-hydrolase [Vicinamibacterales bacterium]|nr:MBL fold metallo-hydrolase [Vicinamibacterales bacterium]